MLARGDRDFVLGEVKPLRRPRRRNRVHWASGLVRHPGQTIVGATAAAVSVAIIVNAVAMQGGPHPAPLFRRVIAPPASAPVLASQPPNPPVRLVERGQNAAAPGTPGAPVVSAAPKATAAAAAPVPVARDPIADMLRAAPATTASTAPDPARAVIAAQKALNKLGYGPVKVDGVAGAGTRQAIEKFERDRKLPVTGEALGRTARDLAALSGVAFD